ncbi:MAG: acyl-CoA dehydrogenase [Pseudonocardiaceae bacterium]|nr:acyl-CoA dehydrogenase [Pseudonocardiaceae bacterium]
MFFALDAEQLTFASTVRDFLAHRFDLDKVRAVVDDTAGDGAPAALWKAAGEQGWLAVLVPEEHDGLGLGMVDAQVIARELGAGVAPGPWAPTVLAGEAVRLGGSAEQQARLLPRLATGQLAATVALRGEGGRYAAAEAPFEARDGRLTGRALPVEYPGIAHTIVAAAGDGLYLVDPAAPGVSVTALSAYDGTTRVGAVELDGAEAEPLPGIDAAAALLDRAAVLTASDLAGVAREALRRTVAYGREREQFGRPVGSFQAIKHALADLHVGITMAEHAVLFAAHAVDAGLPGAALAVSVAKSKAGETAVAATGAMIQYHGGIGYTWEHEAHLFYKRAKRQAAVFGDVTMHRERIAALTIG